MHSSLGVQVSIEGFTALIHYITRILCLLSIFVTSHCAQIEQDFRRGLMC